ncbi:MAG: fumarate hydratase [Syntrophomonadaceae bacterium]|nr:fumarate hydratase [Syntrophomonadaceae bacterium]
MRQVFTSQVVEAVARLCVEANCQLGEDVRRGLEHAVQLEESPLGKEILGRVLENAELAAARNLPLCQDTGLAVVFVEVGQEVSVVGGSLEEAINEGVRQGYRRGYLRKSIVSGLDPRVNTGDNTPAVIFYDLVPGEKLRIILVPKGGGSENMSSLGMLRPSDGVKGIKRFVVEVVEKAGANPCPPVIVGVGIGGTMEKSALLAKRALLRPLGERHPDPQVAVLEKEMLEEINCLGIGPQGLGGRVTALDVHVETYPTHIACLPVAVNLNCHCARHREVEL